MTEIPRRTLPELAFIYEHDSDRRDVYVEGPFDESIVHWFTRECGIQGVAVYPIASIEIHDGDLLAAGQKTNNRERVVHLAKFLATSHARRAACIVDADFSTLRGLTPPERPLFHTDYACMEMYFFSPANFTKFVILCCQRSDWPVDSIMDSLATVLQEFFLFRFANDALEWEMDWLDRNTCLKLNAWQIDLDSDEFVVRLLNKNGRTADKAQFLEHVASSRYKLKADPRQQMNGHDLAALLSWFLRRKGIRSARCRIDNVVACMTLTLDHETLRKESMFQGLSAHLA